LLGGLAAWVRGFTGRRRRGLSVARQAPAQSRLGAVGAVVTRARAGREAGRRRGQGPPGLGGAGGRARAQHLARSLGVAFSISGQRLARGPRLAIAFEGAGRRLGRPPVL